MSESSPPPPPPPANTRPNAGGPVAAPATTTATGSSVGSSVMSKVTSLLMTVTDFYKDINPSTLSGAIDIVVVQHPDGTLAASPFHVRFGKLQLLRPYEKVVEVKINDQVVPDLKMKVGDAGEAFFVVETDDPLGAPDELATSPIAHPVSPPLDSTAASQPTTDTTASGVVEPLDLGESLTLPSPNEQLPADSFVPNDANADARLTPAPPLSDSTHVELALDAAVASAVAASPDLAASTPMSPATLQLGSPTLMDGELTASPKLSAAEAPLPQVTDDLANSYHSASEFELSDQDVLAATDDPAAAPSEAAAPPSPHIAIQMDPAVTSPETSTSTSTAKPLAIHPYSDTELDLDARDHVHATKSRTSPKSDTELEFHELSTSPPASSSMKWMWGWGKMPTVGAAKPVDTADSPTTPTAPKLPLARSLDMAAGESEDTEAPMALSLAGYRKDLTHAEFQAKRITHDQFLAQPAHLLAHPNLVVRMQGQFYPWSVAGPVLASMLAFGQPLPQASVDHLLQQTPAAATAASAPDTKPSRRSTWRWWSRSSNAPPTDRGGVAGGAATPASVLGEFHGDPPVAAAPGKPLLGDTGRAQSELPPTGPLGSPTAPNGSPPFRSQSTGAIDVPLPAAGIDTPAVAGALVDPAPLKRKHYFKTLRLTSDQLKSLPLQRGINHITFTVLSSLQGAAECHSRIFLWDASEHVVISDIDGTITKSDALGHIFTMLGRDWTHSGVASLYTQIRNNGYQMLYLTSRAIGQAQYTRNYLNKVEQGTFQLPDGPVFLSPDRLVAAFTREVIQRRPEEFKVACLRDIRALFAPHTKSPFYAGFGNRHTDAYSYHAVGVPVSRIFTINPEGELKRELLEGYKATYLDLGNLVDQIFPPVGTRHVVDSEFNDWSFWRRGLPTVPVELLGLDDDDEGESDGDALGDPTAEDDDDLGDDDDQDDEDDFEMPGALTELPPGSALARAAGKRTGKRTAHVQGQEAPEGEGEEDEYDGEDEEEQGDDDDDDEQSTLDRVAEFAAFPYI